jgi:hypothetical protein
MIQVPDDTEWGTFSLLYSQFRISRSTGNRLIAARLIEARKLGGRVLINIPSVRDHLRRQPRPALKLDDRGQRLAATSRREENTAA